MIDYSLIRAMLERLREAYPGKVDGLYKLAPDEGKAVQHLAYLREHGLIEISISRDKLGNYNISRAAITAKGIDFLQPDGGLSALAAPTIRIAPESLIAIIDAALASRNVSAEDRSLIQKGLGVAGPEAVKVCVKRLIEAGIAHAPDLLALLRLP